MESSLVTDPTHWKYFSARNFQDDHSVLKTDGTVFWIEYLLTLAATKRSLAGAWGTTMPLIRD